MRVGTMEILDVNIETTERGVPFANERIHNNHIQQAESYYQEKNDSLCLFKEKILPLYKAPEPMKM